MKHTLTFIFLVCSLRTGTYSSTHNHPRHGWTCEVNNVGCTLSTLTGERFEMPFWSKLRYLRAGTATHITIHCQR